LLTFRKLIYLHHSFNVGKMMALVGVEPTLLAGHGQRTNYGLRRSLKKMVRVEGIEPTLF
jgi:hypothetical protein